jgi:RNA polymerase sigma factor (TIGR02999 family)
LRIVARAGAVPARRRAADTKAGAKRFIDGFLQSKTGGAGGSKLGARRGLWLHAQYRDDFSAQGPSMSAGNEVTALLIDWNHGDPAAAERLLTLVYRELRELASGLLRGERVGHTLQPTALVHEAVARLLGDAPLDWDNRAHFFGVMARAMRQVLVDHARRRNADKRGGGIAALELEHALELASSGGIDLIALDDVLRRLETLDATQARIVELRYFVGLSIQETAGVLGLHPSAVNREWAMARAWLKRELT